MFRRHSHVMTNYVLAEHTEVKVLALQAMAPVSGGLQMLRILARVARVASFTQSTAVYTYSQPGSLGASNLIQAIRPVCRTFRSPRYPDIDTFKLQLDRYRPCGCLVSLVHPNTNQQLFKLHVLSVDHRREVPCSDPAVPYVQNLYNAVKT